MVLSRYRDREVFMVNHGRLAKVMFMLIVAMTLGALILLAFEGKPIKPMPFSLSRPTQLTSIHSALSTESGIELGRWKRIVVVYNKNSGFQTQKNGLTGELSLKYHFIISNGSGAGDGEIYTSQRWFNQLACLPMKSPKDSSTINICLLTDTGQNHSTPRQARQLESLISNLVKNCQIEPKIVWNNN
jgi:hypothetical protein